VQKIALLILGLMILVQAHAAEESIAARLKQRGITLPTMAKPAGNYLPYQISGNKIYISQIAFKDGKILGPGPLVNEKDIPRGQLAARQTVLNILAVVQQACGSLEDIEKVVRLDGYIASHKNFTQQAQVMNGASDVLVEILGERGKHARSAVGSIVLPLNSAVEISAVIELKPKNRG